MSVWHTCTPHRSVKGGIGYSMIISDSVYDPVKAIGFRPSLSDDVPMTRLSNYIAAAWGSPGHRRKAMADNCPPEVDALL